MAVMVSQRLRDDQFERLLPAARLRPWREPVPARTAQAVSLTEEAQRLQLFLSCP